MVDLRSGHMYMCIYRLCIFMYATRAGPHVQTKQLKDRQLKSVINSKKIVLLKCSSRDYFALIIAREALLDSRWQHHEHDFLFAL